MEESPGGSSGQKTGTVPATRDGCRLPYWLQWKGRTKGRSSEEHTLGIKQPLASTLVPTDLCAVRYVSVNTAVQHVVRLSPGTLMAKEDIQNPY